MVVSACELAWANSVSLSVRSNLTWSIRFHKGRTTLVCFVRGSIECVPCDTDTLIKPEVADELEYSRWHAVAAAFAAHAGVSAVWAVNDSEKIDRDTRNIRPRRPTPHGTAKRSGSSARATKSWPSRSLWKRTRTESRAFPRACRSWRRRAESRRSSTPRRTPIPPATRGAPIQLFSVNYMEVVKATAASWIYRLGTPSAPANPMGWKPVQLVPENAKRGKGGFPLAVGPSQNQALWVEIYLRRDLPAGFFQGNLELDIDGQKRALPVELEVLDFALPDENSMHAMVFHESRSAGPLPGPRDGRRLSPLRAPPAHRTRPGLRRGEGNRFMDASRAATSRGTKATKAPARARAIGSCR